MGLQKGGGIHVRFMLIVDLVQLAIYVACNCMRWVELIAPATVSYQASTRQPRRQRRLRSVDVSKRDRDTNALPDG